jgi:hypothetical protein
MKVEAPIEEIAGCTAKNNDEITISKISAEKKIAVLWKVNNGRLVL